MASESSGYLSDWVLKWGAEVGSDAFRSWGLPSGRKILNVYASAVVEEVGRSLRLACSSGCPSVTCDRSIRESSHESYLLTKRPKELSD